jgi:hypothetical protein
MSVTQGLDIDKIYSHFKKKGNLKYHEETHCKLLIKVMMDKGFGCHSAFCTQAMISEQTFYVWVRTHELFRNLWFFTKMVAKQLWYEEGKQIRDKEYQIGTMNYEFEHWKLMGWTKFGISRNSRIRINLEAEDTPAKHYAAILRQAAEGDFTASEFKQLMEAVNIGLRVHEVFELQKEIDELKSDMAIMKANTNVKNPFADKGTSEAD